MSCTSAKVLNDQILCSCGLWMRKQSRMPATAADPAHRHTPHRCSFRPFSCCAVNEACFVMQAPAVCVDLSRLPCLQESKPSSHACECWLRACRYNRAWCGCGRRAEGTPSWRACSASQSSALSSRALLRSNSHPRISTMSGIFQVPCPLWRS